MNTASFRSYTDEDLMELFQSGYEQAYTCIVERYRERIHNFLFRYTKNHLDCEDLVQETFFRVYKCRNSYERIAKFSTWLYTIAGNLAKSQFKKASKMPTFSISGFGEEEQEADFEIRDVNALPENEVEESMTVAAVMKALEQLPADFRDVVLMRDVQNMTYEEIEQITGLAMGTVKSRINRGRARLQKMLKHVVDLETYAA
jgi:RNA polymerase sigma-70 factor (ECF subfamily)